jgi:hypothetical protein
MAEEGCSSIDLSGMRVDPSQIMGCGFTIAVPVEAFAASLHRELVWRQSTGAGTDDLRGTRHYRKRMDPCATAASSSICCAPVSDDGMSGERFQKRHLLDVDQEASCQAHPWPANP